MTPKTLTKERREKFEEILNNYSVFIRHLPNEKDRKEWTKKLAEELVKASISRTEAQKEEVVAASDKKVDAIIELAKQANAAEEAGKAWRGRELIMTDYQPYGDWWHNKTGLHMYPVKGKAKADATWLKEFQAWWQNDLSFDALNTAYKNEIEWKKVISHPRELTAKALAIQAAPVVVSTREEGKSSGYFA